MPEPGSEVVAPAASAAAPAASTAQADAQASVAAVEIANATEAAPAADAATQAAQTPEAKAAADAEAATAKATADAEAAAKAADAAPEAYTDFVAPKDVALDPEVVTAFQGVAKTLNLSQAKAQSVIDAIGPVIAARTVASVTQRAEAARTKWGADARADAEIGGEALDANLATAKVARDAFFTKDFNAFLDSSGLGNHPELIRGFVKMGKAMKADGKVVVGDFGAGARPLEERLWGGKKSA